MSEAVKLGVVGCGYTGRMTVNATTQLARVDTVAIADFDPQRRDEVGREYGVPRSYETYQELLADSEVAAVYLGTQLNVRTPMVHEALGAGKHALVQKPHAHRARDILEMKAAAEQAGVTLQFCFYLRHLPHNRSTRQAIRNGGIGEPYHGRYFSKNGSRPGPGEANRWAHESENRCGVLAMHMSHDLDLLWWWMGMPTPRWAFGVKHSIETAYDGLQEPVEDYFSGLVGFEDGKTIQIDCSSVSHADSARVLELHGTTGAVAGGPRCGVSRADQRVADEAIYRRGESVFIREEIDDPCDVDHSRPDPVGVNPFYYETEHFAMAVRGEVKPDMNADDAYVYARMMDALYDSALTAEKVVIDDLKF